MHELIKLSEKTYYISGSVNIGIYLINEHDVCVIDTGNSIDYGIMIDKVLEQKSWNLKYIINTHSHYDHISGNNYLQNKYKCKIYACSKEKPIVEMPIIEASVLYGACPIKDLQRIVATPSKCLNVDELKEDGIKIIDLAGHSIGLIGVVTSDNICFVGDAFTSKENILKYPIQYTYDIGKYFNTLDKILNMDYKAYVPAHGYPVSDPKETIKLHKSAVLNIKGQIINLAKTEISYTNLLKNIFELHHIKMNSFQYYIVGSTIKAYITELEKNDDIIIFYKDNEMFVKGN